MKPNDIPTPFYIVYEEKLRLNLELIARVKKEAGVNIIMAFKANALWKTFPIIKEYVRDSTASSLNEMRLGNEELGGVPGWPQADRVGAPGWNGGAVCWICCRL